MKSIAASMALLALAAGPAVAQTDAPPSAHQRELARQRLSEMHFEKQLDVMTGVMGQALSAGLKSSNPNADQTKVTAMMSAMQDEMHEVGPKMEALAEDLYARELTEKELVDTAAFYNTESGQALLRKMPALTQKITPMMLQLMPEMQKGMLRRYCLKVTCSKEEKAKLAQLSAAR